MINKINIIVEKTDSGERLDKFIALLFPHISRRTVQETIAKGFILVNGKTGKKGIMLNEGDNIEIKEMPEPSDMFPSANPSLLIDIVYEDKNLLIVNKPAGMPSHPLAPLENNTVVNFILNRCPEVSGFGYSPLEPAILHRLDINTSGLLMAAKNEVTFARIRAMMKDKLITKTYLALVLGKPEKNGVITSSIRHHDKDKRKMKACLSSKDEEGGKIYEAETAYKVAKSFNGYSLLEVTIKSAVMHQIRCHLASINHPISGDSLYQSHRHKKSDTLAPSRHLLHAWKISIPEENGMSALEVTAPVPEDFEDYMARLTETK